MMNPTRFCGALFLFFFSAIAAVLAGQSKPSTPAGQPVNLFRKWSITKVRFNGNPHRRLEFRLTCACCSRL